MTTRFWWVRHGPTHAKGFVGWKDIPADLSDTAALQRLEAYLPADAAVVSSDLQRAVATADAIAGNRRRLPHDPQLREMDFGDWDGLPMTEVERISPVESRKFWSEPGDIAPPNGESWNALSGRVAAAVNGIISEHGPGDIIAVAHFAVILSSIQRASGMTPKAVFSFRIDNLSVTRLDFIHDARSWRVGGVNHLP